MSYIDLEKAYDRTDGDALWNVKEMYGVIGNLLFETRQVLGRPVCD